MVYPQVKAILHFDNKLGGYMYSLNGNSTVKAAYDKATAENPTLVKSLEQSSPSFVKLNGASGLKGNVTLRAYCDVPNQSVTVTYLIDGHKRVHLLICHLV